MQQRITLIFILLFQLTALAQPQGYYVVKNLEIDWLVKNENGSYSSTNKNTKETTVYIPVDVDSYKGDYLRISSSESFSVYLDHKLIYFDKDNLLIDLDSLSDAHPSPWLLAVHHRDQLAWLSTLIISETDLLSPLALQSREGNYFLDFSILAAVLLGIFFVALLRTNPKLTLDYLNFVRLLSLQEREDTLLNSRISSSGNILYYGFISLLSAYLLLVIFHFGGSGITTAEYFSVETVWEGMLRWMQLTLIMIGVLGGKLIVISLMANLFNSRESMSFQLYNYVRLLFFVCGVTSLVMICYFVFKIQNAEAYSFLSYGIIFSLIFWLILISLKLLWQSAFRSIHLFSYLCGSELIPVVFIIKVLNS